jgi:hypothetical protein
MPTMPSEFNNTWWQNVLAEFEPAQYYSSPQGISFAARSPSRGRYFRNAYEDVMKDWYGTAGTTMRGGGEPISFMDYLETNPWTARYGALPQTARGATGMATNPRTRFLYNY